MLTAPTLILSFVLATLYAAAFHLLRGKTGRQLLFTWLSALLGFGLGQMLGVALSWSDTLIGEVHLVSATVLSWLAMLLVRKLRL